MNHSEDSLKLALLIERLATVARDAGAKPVAALDVARRIITDHAGELMTGGVIRLGSGATVFDAIESTRADMPEYFAPTPERPSSSPPPPSSSSPSSSSPTTSQARRKRASDRLSRANGDVAPRLNGGDE